MRSHFCGYCGSQYSEEQLKQIEENKETYCVNCGEKYKTSIFFCHSCGYQFLEEEFHMNEKSEKFYCPNCNQLYLSNKIAYNEATISSSKEDEKYSEQEDIHEKAIIIFGKYSFIPVLLFSAFWIILEWHYKLFVEYLPQYLLSGSFFFYTTGIIISLYDIFYVNKKIKKKEYNDIVLNSIFLGIIGSLIFFSGIFILIKGILIYSFVKKKTSTQNNSQFKKYLLNSFLGVLPMFVLCIVLIRFFLPFAIFLFFQPFVFFYYILFALYFLIIVNRIKAK